MYFYTAWWGSCTASHHAGFHKTFSGISFKGARTIGDHILVQFASAFTHLGVDALFFFKAYTLIHLSRLSAFMMRRCRVSNMSAPSETGTPCCLGDVG